MLENVFFFDLLKSTTCCLTQLFILLTVFFGICLHDNYELGLLYYIAEKNPEKTLLFMTKILQKTCILPCVFARFRTVKCMFSVIFSSWTEMFFRDIFRQYSRTVQVHYYHAKISRKKKSQVWNFESNNMSTIWANWEKNIVKRRHF